MVEEEGEEGTHNSGPSNKKKICNRIYLCVFLSVVCLMYQVSTHYLFGGWKS